MFGEVYYNLVVLRGLYLETHTLLDSWLCSILEAFQTPSKLTELLKRSTKQTSMNSDQTFMVVNSTDFQIPTGIYSNMFGPDGDPTVAILFERIMQNWTIIGRLHLVRVPTLVINGKKDISQDFVVQPSFDRIQKVKRVTLENSSHSPFIEETERPVYMKLISI
ncbi:L-amino acid amidase [Psilocybe cubensis]|uniref:L-amino acid amidase n=1 Tax=Psilocybe cubensis TaxID=181762 RepID=A0ACB8GME8_PSICU|nr:L-amino acid amidase [Psilocybe cubensis]KAH9476731.1 L-amino acid amidase [Psilocybe cubensis]